MYVIVQVVFTLYCTTFVHLFCIPLVYKVADAAKVNSPVMVTGQVTQDTHQKWTVFSTFTNGTSPHTSILLIFHLFQVWQDCQIRLKTEEKNKNKQEAQ